MSHIPDKRELPDSMPDTTPYPKRIRLSYADGEVDDAPAATHAPKPSAHSYERPRNDPVYGQKSAFPGLDVEIEDELFYGPAEDGMEYLRMVRSEANSLPLWFTAPKASQVVESIYVEEHKTKDKDVQNGPTQLEKNEGTYFDGVYVAPPTTTTTTAAAATETITTPNTTEESPYPPAQQSYYTLLHHRYLLLRSILKCTPPHTSIAALPDTTHPISLPRNSYEARKEWRRLVLVVDPRSVQLACMDNESVLGVLRIITKLLSENVKRGDLSLVKRTSAWVWGLLGKCREVGELGTEEVGEIRDLGKRAVTILAKVKEDERRREGKREQEREEMEPGDTENENEPGDTSGIVERAHGDSLDAPGKEAHDLDMPDATTEQPDELETARVQLQTKIQDNSRAAEAEEEQAQSDAESLAEVALQTHAMLDMIITVVGEYYGQKDLLQEREVWGCE